MQMRYVILAGFLTTGACQSPLPPPAPPGNVDSGRSARETDVAAYQCSVPDEEVCACERAAIASGIGPEVARTACAP